MKLIGTFFFLSIFLSCYSNSSKVYTDNTKNSLTERNLKGKIKTIKVKSCSFVKKIDKIQKKECSIEISKYNINGNKTEVFNYSFDGSLNYTETYQYNEKGLWTKVIILGSDGSLMSKTSNTFDEKGKIVEDTVNSPSTGTTKTVYKYDDLGNLKQVNSYNSEDSLESRIIYNCDEKRNMVELLYYIKDGTLKFKSTTKYDKKDNPIESKTYSSNGNLEVETWKYDKFDKKGNWISRTFYINGEPLTIEEREIQYFD
jgi:hypothetical protein